MSILAAILFGFGLIAWFLGEVRLLALVYRRSFLWFFGCLFVPFVIWVFFLFNAKQAWKPVAMATVGFLLTGLGYWMGGL